MAENTEDLIQVMAFGSFDVGVTLVAATSLLWPGGAWVYIALPRQVGLPAWRVFVRAGVAALTVAALFAGWAAWLLASNGTTQSMISLGPQVAALTCLGGAAICGVIALMLRLRHRRSSVSDNTPHSGSQ